MILTLYVIPCKLSCDFTKLTILYIYIYMYIYSIIFMTNKSVMTFLYVNKYISISYQNSDVFSLGMLEYGDGTQTVRQTTRGKLITFDPKCNEQRSMVALLSTWHHQAHGATLTHRNRSHSVSSVDLIGPCFENQPKIHILKICDAACTVSSTHWERNFKYVKHTKWI